MPIPISAESEAMWNFIDREMYPRRPILAKIPDDTWYKERNAFRLIDGEIFPKPAGKASFSLITPSAQKTESGRGDMREDILPAVVEKILCHNARALYGLS
jgi:hypothetical protein